eukprot:2827372-Amphidinium_carterae.1
MIELRPPWLQLDEVMEGQMRTCVFSLSLFERSWSAHERIQHTSRHQNCCACVLNSRWRGWNRCLRRLSLLAHGGQLTIRRYQKVLNWTGCRLIGSHIPLTCHLKESVVCVTADPFDLNFPKASCEQREL